MLAAARSRAGLRIEHSSEEDFIDEIAQSDAFWDCIFDVAVYRESVTQACNHPHQPAGALAQDELEAAPRTISELKELNAELKALVQFTGVDFQTRPSHLQAQSLQWIFL